MSVNITDADSYIALNVIDVDDWQSSETERKQRLLNVAQDKLTRRYPDYTIPENAVYEYAAVLSVVYNDTLKQKQYGVSNMSVAGMSFTFRDSVERPIEFFIPQSSLDLIGDANDVKLSKNKVGKSVL